MRTAFILMITLSFMAGCVTLSMAESADWIYYGVEKLGVHYYDRQSIKSISKNVRQVWTKHVITTKEQRNLYIKYLNEKNLPTRGDEDVSYRLDLSEINCSTAEIRLTSYSEYNTSSMPIYSESNLMLKPLPIPPDSIANALYKIVCKSTKK